MNTADFDECGKVGVHRMLYYNKNRGKGEYGIYISRKV
jgi:hypothetical protein